MPSSRGGNSGASGGIAASSSAPPPQPARPILAQQGTIVVGSRAPVAHREAVVGALAVGGPAVTGASDGSVAPSAILAQQEAIVGDSRTVCRRAQKETVVGALAVGNAAVTVWSAAVAWWQLIKLSRSLSALRSARETTIAELSCVKQPFDPARGTSSSGSVGGGGGGSSSRGGSSGAGLGWLLHAGSSSSSGSTSNGSTSSSGCGGSSNGSNSSSAGLKARAGIQVRAAWLEETWLPCSNPAAVRAWVDARPSPVAARTRREAAMWIGWRRGSGYITPERLAHWARSVQHPIPEIHPFLLSRCLPPIIATCRHLTGKGLPLGLRTDERVLLINHEVTAVGHVRFGSDGRPAIFASPKLPYFLFSGTKVGMLQRLNREWGVLLGWCLLLSAAAVGLVGFALWCEDTCSPLLFSPRLSSPLRSSLSFPPLSSPFISSPLLSSSLPYPHLMMINIMELQQQARAAGAVTGAGAAAVTGVEAVAAAGAAAGAGAAAVTGAGATAGAGEAAGAGAGEGADTAAAATGAGVVSTGWRWSLENLIRGGDTDEEEVGGEEEVQSGELCVVCLHRKRKAVFIPCGHRACCLSCSRVVWVEHSPCPICRGQVLAAYRVYDA
ncbi:unnamed protein product [Closterium sp. NIES-54]